MEKKEKQKVFVGLSGGVDSSVSAYMLQKEGYDVEGVFIRVWYPDFLECNWKEERRDAMRVCAHLNIPFHELDLHEEYKAEVADYMIAEYTQGRTPNPDVMCNRYVKFGGFLRWAKENGANYIATGHYAQNINNTLHAGLDTNKDQSYFLWTLTQEQLTSILFPIGHLEKKEVRAIAKKAGLLTASKKDSQGVCFLGEISMKEFLSHYIENKKGDVLNEKGDVIGHHNGALFFTIGERRGFAITQKTPHDKPYFVIAKDIEKNTITVSDKTDSNSALFNGNKVFLIDTHWAIKTTDTDIYKARIRYRQPLQNCRVEGDVVTFDEPQKALAAGQSCVVYKGDMCVGGGIIDAVI